MTKHTITVTVPEDLYDYLERRAGVTQLSIEDMLIQTARNAATPPIESDLPAHIRSELAALPSLSDEVLWSIAQSMANTDKVVLYDVLLERHQAGTITPEGAILLRQLRDEADALMLRKAQAFMLLKNRGYTLPSVDGLPVPAL